MAAGAPYPYDGCPAWFDHGTRWTRDGQPFALVGQPYQLTAEDVRELAALERVGLAVTVATSPAWHGPGVLSVLITRGAA